MSKFEKKKSEDIDEKNVIESEKATTNNNDDLNKKIVQAVRDGNTALVAKLKSQIKG